MDGQIKLYGKQIPYDGQPLWMFGDCFGANLYALDIKAMQKKQGEIPQKQLVKMLKGALEQQKTMVAEAQLANSIREIVTVQGLTDKIEKAQNTIRFLEDALPILR